MADRTPRGRSSGIVAALAVLAVFAPQPGAARQLEPIADTIRIPSPASHLIEVTAAVPTDGREAIDLMMPVWSPGYYRVEDHAANVRDLSAATETGQALTVESIRPSRWRVVTRGARQVRLFYRVFCNQRSVTTNEVVAEYAVLNGAPTFITLAGRERRRHDITIEMPAGWTQAMSGLDDRGPARFRAADYETLVDGTPHFIVSAGNSEGWDPDAATRDLRTFVEENRRLWGVLPYDKYLFLLLFRPGGGGLEHKNSNRSTVVAGFRRAVSSTEELDYADLLEWYGLRFAPSDGAITGNWTLEVRPDQTEAQKQNLARWLAPPSR